MNYKLVSIDLAKTVFQIAAFDAHNRIAFNRKIKRPALLNWVSDQRTNIRKSVIGFDGKVLRGDYRSDPKTALQLVTAYDT